MMKGGGDKKPSKVERLSCHECGQLRSKSNISRHMLTHQNPGDRQRSSSASSIRCRASMGNVGASSNWDRESVVSLRQSVESLDDVDGRSTIESFPEGRFAGLSSVTYSIAHTAAVAMITESHASYNAVELCNYVNRHYPQVPRESRLCLSIGVAAGAQHASHVHFFAEMHRATRYLTSKRSLKRHFACYELGMCE